MTISHSEKTGFKTQNYDADICIVGAGLSGMCAAIAAARLGARVVLMHDRPVFGGNASSEIRMWVCGAHGENNRETGIIEEIELDNIRRNPDKNYSLWDGLLYEKVRFQKNLASILNCSCQSVEMDGARITSVTGYQTTTQSYHRVSARVFLDCSGDSVLAPLTGAEYRKGREAREEFGEDIEPVAADENVMGMSCLIQAREHASAKEFIAPDWAYRYESKDDLPFRDTDPTKTNFWWIETGGLGDTIAETENVRDELLKVAFGVWDHIKNRGSEFDARNWELDWVGFLPGKRESRRYVGDYIVHQNDVRAGGPFDDVVAYGGWSMDDHHPAGVHHPGEPTVFHPAPSPWGIPYRSLYSRNVENLMFAGRNISVTHIALSSCRVMRTCSVIGQAAGTAAALAVRHAMSPREIGASRIGELQQELMEQDCWLPGHARTPWQTTREAGVSASHGDAEMLRSGHDRQIGDEANAWETPIGEWAEYRFTEPREITRGRLVFDSELSRYYRDHRQKHSYRLSDRPTPVAPELVRSARIEAQDEAGNWSSVAEIRDNHQRLVRFEFESPVRSRAFRLVPTASWGRETVRIFAWDLK